LDSREVPGDFHARFSATAKEYRYTVHNSRSPDPFLRRYSLFFPRNLDVDAMRGESGALLGKHDFSAFKAEGSPVKSTVRTLYDLRIEQREDIINLFFRGDGFLYNMVRIMVGTLLDIGLHKFSPGALGEILASKDRKRAGPTAPPQGLCLMEVFYDR
jgi:tRNA pseudouridine38-40 synthase